MNTRDLFDTIDLSDLPESFVPVVTFKNSQRKKRTDRIMELLEIAGRPLSAQEITVGLYRKYGDEVKQIKIVHSALSLLCNTGRAARIGVNNYTALSKQGKSNGPGNRHTRSA